MRRSLAGRERRSETFRCFPPRSPGRLRRGEVSSSRAAADAMLGSVRNGALPGRSPRAGVGPRAPAASLARPHNTAAGARGLGGRPEGPRWFLPGLRDGGRGAGRGASGAPRTGEKEEKLRGVRTGVRFAASGVLEPQRFSVLKVCSVWAPGTLS